jgi:Flp pilus assembly protein TadD
MTRILLVLMFALAGCGVNTAERNNAGISSYSQGDSASALRDFQAAQVASPDQAEPYFNAASAYTQSGDLDRALAALQQALKTANDDLAAQAYYNLGNVYFEMRRFEDAVQAYEQSLLLHPDDEDARHNLELALKQIVSPSPTPDSQNATPTPDQQGGQAAPSPVAASPTPQDNSTAGSDVATPESPLTVEDAENLLDGIRRDQRTLQQVLATPANSTGKDW